MRANHQYTAYTLEHAPLVQLDLSGAARLAERPRAGSPTAAPSRVGANSGARNDATQAAPATSRNLHQLAASTINHQQLLNPHLELANLDDIAHLAVATAEQQVERDEPVASAEAQAAAAAVASHRFAPARISAGSSASSELQQQQQRLSGGSIGRETPVVAPIFSSSSHATNLHLSRSASHNGPAFECGRQQDEQHVVQLHPNRRGNEHEQLYAGHQFCQQLAPNSLQAPFQQQQQQQRQLGPSTTGSSRNSSLGLVVGGATVLASSASTADSQTNRVQRHLQPAASQEAAPPPVGHQIIVLAHEAGQTTTTATVAG